MPIRREHIHPGEDVRVEEASVDRQRAEHDRVHEHPPDERRGRALVEGQGAFVAEGGGEAGQGAGEARGGGGLQADFDGVEGVAD